MPQNVINANANASVTEELSEFPLSPLCLRVWVGLHVVVVAPTLLSALENVQMNFLLVRDDEH